MSAEIATKPFQIDDYDAALALWQRVDGVEIAEGDSRAEIAQFLHRNPGLSRVAFDGSTLMGIALCGEDGHRGHIYHLAVDPAARRRGLGKRLVAECLEALRATGVRRVIVLVADENPEGHAFWTRLGWEDIDGAIAMGINL